MVTHPLRQALANIITRVAQHACRQGESGNRCWPPLQRLPLLESWRCVGEEYADDALAELMAAAMVSTEKPLRPKPGTGRKGARK
jgi:hypothetical protein